MRARDVVTLAILAWWLLKDRESTSVELTETCVNPITGETIVVPLGECPPGYILVTESDFATPPYAGLQGCNCGGCG